MQAPRSTRRASEEDAGLLSARSAGSELWLDPRRVSRRASEEDFARCACGAVLLFGATVCWKCHGRSRAEQAIDDEFGIFYAGERQSAPDTGSVERISLYDLPARSASEPVLCRPGCEAPSVLEPEPFGTAAGWEAILEDNDRAHRELERCRFELQDCRMELEESRGVTERLRARVAELELQVKLGSAQLSEKQSTPGFGDEDHFAIELADVASPSARRMAAPASEGWPLEPAGGFEELRAAGSRLLAGPPLLGVGGASETGEARTLAEALGGEAQLREERALGGAVRAEVRRGFADALAAGALERALAPESTEAAPQASPDARPREASARRPSTEAEGGSVPERPQAALPSGSGPPGGSAASAEGRLAEGQARELLGQDALDEGLQQRLAQVAASEETAYRAALGECERRRAALAAAVSAELARAGRLGPARQPRPGAAPRPGAGAARAAAAGGSTAQPGPRELLERKGSKMERRCRRLQQELAEQSALAPGPPGGAAGDAPLVCELRRECERLREDAEEEDP
ncbi:unnamed protein product [Prorocentrum cordatum]|uniref:Uncharacterized protein n=1 Tax=Prorocentrum cordatum TaxID=2364126 RepID=A0ABN9XNP9_9DINO|nr:unnamed protein product [Polarella glacialis]